MRKIQECKQRKEKKEVEYVQRISYTTTNTCRDINSKSWPYAFINISNISIKSSTIHNSSLMPHARYIINNHQNHQKIHVSLALPSSSPSLAPLVPHRITASLLCKSNRISLTITLLPSCTTSPTLNASPG
jgi:hypothetical protein